MAKWFDEKLDDKKVRSYTKRNLSQSKFEKIARKLSLTNWLIIINVVIFVLFFILGKIFSEEELFKLFALQPILFFSGSIWTALTSIFLHGSVGHLFANMVSLFFIGNFVEKLIGRKRFIAFYLISGIFASLFYVILSFYFGSICIVNLPLIGCIGGKIFVDPIVYAVGASGAIFALLGLLAILTPKNKVFLIAGPLIAIVLDATLSSIFPNSDIVGFFSFFVTFYILFSIFAMFSFNKKIYRFSIPLEMEFWVLPIVAIVPLMIVGLFVALPIGNTAHLGGLIAGIIFGLYLKAKYKKKTEMINKYFSK